MAEKRTVELEIKENFKQVEKDLNSLDKSLDNTANSARDVNKSFEDVYGDLQPLTTRMGEAEDRLYELGAAGDFTSKEYQNLLKTVGEYRQVQIRTDLAVDAASMTMSQKLSGSLMGAASAFELVQGSMALFGVESEELQATILKVKGAMALSEGLQGLMEAKNSFKQLGIVAKNALSGIKTGIAATGIGLIENENNVGTGVRVDFGYKNANKFGASTIWSDANAKPIDDIKRIVKIAAAKGDMIKFLMMSDTTFDKLAENEQTRQNFAFSQNFSGDNANIPTPDLTQVNTLMQRKFGLTIIVVDRTVTTERDGVRTVQTPWAVNNVIFLTSNKVGKLAYGILAEETRKSPKVMYEKSGSYILLKKWSTEEPFAEFTSSQALVIPVINNVDSIYLLNCEEAVTDAQTENDANFDYKEDSYTRTSVIAGINAAVGKTKAKSTNTDAKLLEYVNELSEEQILVFEATIVPSA